VLAIGVLLEIKPLHTQDLEMVGEVNKRVVRYLRWFGRGVKS
jgi:hypothetical protein